MRGGYDGVDISEEEEPSDESIESVRLGIGKLLMDQRPCGFAQPSDAKGNCVNRLLQLLEDLEHKILQHWDVLSYQGLDPRVALSLQWQVNVGVA